MRFNSFDFFSSAPQSFIFHQRSNKSNFGGALSLIYIVIFLVISLFYLISYLNKDEYSIQYLYQEKGLTNEEIIKMVNNERFNPHFNICVGIVAENKEIKERLEIRRYNNFLHSQLNTSICHSIRMKDISWMIVYDCFNKSFNECKIEPDEYGRNSFNIYMYYNGFVLDHQNKTSPLYRKNGNEVSHSLNSEFEIFNPSRRVHTFNLIRYKEEKGFFSIFENEEDNDYIGLSMKTYDYSEMSGLNGDKQIYIREIDMKSKSIHNYKVLGRIRLDVDFQHYDEYKRTPKSFLDVLANICSLSMTILNGISYTLVTYFSNNFDNYKIMEKILYDTSINPEKKQKKNKEIEEPNDNVNKKEDLIDKSNEDKDKLIINDEIESENDKVIIDKDFNIGNENFPDLNLFDLLFNAIYDDKCCKIDIKKLILKCREIVSKYYSIEYIIYNQIKLENLLKDYRWNDPRLNNLDNNELISQLKSIISSFNNY